MGDLFAKLLLETVEVSTMQELQGKGYDRTKLMPVRVAISLLEGMQSKRDSKRAREALQSLQKWRDD